MNWSDKSIWRLARVETSDPLLTLGREVLSLSQLSNFGVGPFYTTSHNDVTKLGIAVKVVVEKSVGIPQRFFDIPYIDT